MSDPSFERLKPLVFYILAFRGERSCELLSVSACAVILILLISWMQVVKTLLITLNAFLQRRSDSWTMHRGRMQATNAYAYRALVGAFGVEFERISCLRQGRVDVLFLDHFSMLHVADARRHAGSILREHHDNLRVALGRCCSHSLQPLFLCLLSQPGHLKLHLVLVNLLLPLVLLDIVVARTRNLVLFFHELFHLIIEQAQLVFTHHVLSRHDATFD